MSARPSNNHFESPTAQRLRHNCVRTCTVKHKACPDGIFPPRIGKNLAHAAEIAFALFAHISNRKKGFYVRNFEQRKGGGNRQQGSHPRRVVGYARPKKLSTVLSDIERRTRREDRIQVSTDGDEHSLGGWLGTGRTSFLGSRFPRSRTTDIADSVFLPLTEPNGPH